MEVSFTKYLKDKVQCSICHTVPGIIIFCNCTVIKYSVNKLLMYKLASHFIFSKLLKMGTTQQVIHMIKTVRKCMAGKLFSHKYQLFLSFHLLFANFINVLTEFLFLTTLIL